MPECPSILRLVIISTTFLCLCQASFESNEICPGVNGTRVACRESRAAPQNSSMGSRYPRGKRCGSNFELWHIKDLELLRDCRVVDGFVRLLHFENVSREAYDAYSFPELVEITNHFLMYRVFNLTSVRQLFPNLAVIGGFTLFKYYSFVLLHNQDLKEIGLTKLVKIQKGGVWISGSPGWACQLKWTSLRNQYRAAIRRKRFCEIAGIPLDPDWKYQGAMSFLEPHLSESRPDPQYVSATIVFDTKVPVLRKVRDIAASFEGKVCAVKDTVTPDSKVPDGSNLDTPNSEVKDPAVVPDLVTSLHSENEVVDTKPDIVTEAKSEDSGFPEIVTEVVSELAPETIPVDMLTPPDSAVSESDNLSETSSVGSPWAISSPMPIPARFLHPHLTRSFRHRVPRQSSRRARKAVIAPKPAPPQQPVVPRVCQVQNFPVTASGLTVAVPAPRGIVRQFVGILRRDKKAARIV